MRVVGPAGQVAERLLGVAQVLQTPGLHAETAVTTTGLQSFTRVSSEPTKFAPPGWRRYISNMNRQSPAAYEPVGFMSSAEQLEQQLLALIEGRLNDGEAEALTRRITSDPEVARAYAEAKLEWEERAESPSDCDGGRPGLLRRLCRLFGGG